MKSILHSLLKPSHHHHHHQTTRTLSDAPSIKWVRDRALDHAVEKERNLKPMLNLKTLINSQPSKSLPLSIISQNQHSLQIPIRPIDFIRKYPSIFEEFLPGGIGINPHVKLTPEVIELDTEEHLVYHTENHKQEVADRLLKLLMIGRINKIPLCLLDSLKFDLGLPQDYTQSVVPEFPDYFQVTGNGGNGDLFLELVCWSNELAVSVIEKKALRSDVGYKKGMPIAFPLQYSRGFEMDKKFKKWVDDWQKLPYISPYENFDLSAKSDESDKWAVSVLHEVLNLFVPKKTEKDNVLYLGEYLGLRSRFKRALLQHPGIFYISSKVRTHTVVLREAYKRDLLIGNHPLMDMRSKYIHLMYQVKEGSKAKTGKDGKTGPCKAARDSKEGEGEVEGDESGNEQDEQLSGVSDSEFEDESDDDDYDDEEDESDDDEDESVTNRGRSGRKSRIEVKRPLTNVSNRSARGNPNKIRDPRMQRFSRGGEKGGGRNVRGRSQERFGKAST